jgi:hypothetical protein
MLSGLAEPHFRGGAEAVLIGLPRRFPKKKLGDFAELFLQLIFPVIPLALSE